MCEYATSRLDNYQGQLRQCTFDASRVAKYTRIFIQSTKTTDFLLHEWNPDMDRKGILSKLASGELTEDEADKLLDELERQKRGSLYCKVSQKGAISIYGLQRMPVTLYVEQWERLLNFADDIRQFSEDHGDELKRKGG